MDKYFLLFIYFLKRIISTMSGTSRIRDESSRSFINMNIAKYSGLSSPEIGKALNQRRNIQKKSQNFLMKWMMRLFCQASNTEADGTVRRSFAYHAVLCHAAQGIGNLYLASCFQTRALLRCYVLASSKGHISCPILTFFDTISASFFLLP